MNAKPIDKCQEVVELVNEYLGHRLTPDEQVAFEAHLATCPDCTTYLGQMKTVISTAGSLDNLPMPAEVETPLMALFEDWHKRRPR